MPTRRKFRRNNRKTRRRGKKGGKGHLDLVMKAGENETLSYGEG